MADGSGKVDVTHALTPYLGTGYLYTAALTNNALVTDTLVLTAVTLPVLGGTEDALEKRPSFSGFKVR